MDKNLPSNQILLLVIATVLLLLAAFSFYLLQDPSAPLPFSPPPTTTITLPPASASHTPAPSSTEEPTRQTSYTPFASPAVSETTAAGSGSPIPDGTMTVSPLPDETTIPLSPTPTTTPQVSVTASFSPTASPTLIAGEYEVTGRIVQNGTPVSNVLVEFTDDAPARKRTSDSRGYYSFITLAPGTTFSLEFSHNDNPQLTPIQEVASMARIEGTLPTGENIIELPDLEVSLNIDGMIFRLVSPVDGATFSAAVISPSNPIQFTWTLYNQGAGYYIELGSTSSDEPLWISGDTTSTSLMWNGTLNDGSHISEGAYWWRVGVNMPLGRHEFTAFTHEWDLLLNP
jgi:hypothetical protein